MDKITIYRVELWCGSGNSNKEYTISINQSPHTGKCTVDVEYGRRGTRLKEITKTPTPVTQNAAQVIASTLVMTKKNKGYHITREVSGAQKDIQARMAKFRLERLYLNDQVSVEHYSKLSGMLASSDDETITLVTSIIEQKLQGNFVNV